MKIKQNPDMIKGELWVSCSECGFELESGKDKYSTFDNLINDPIYLCEKCINNITKESKHEENHYEDEIHEKSDDQELFEDDCHERTKDMREALK